MASDIPLSSRAACARAALALLIVAALAACGLPRDPHGTLDRVQGGTLRAGLVAAEPGETQDRARLQGFARALNAGLEVRTGESHDLIAALEEGRLDLVASLPRSTPFNSIGFTRPFDGPDGEKRVWAVRAGENGFLVRADRFLADHDAVGDGS